MKLADTGTECEAQITPIIELQCETSMIGDFSLEEDGNGVEDDLYASCAMASIMMSQLTHPSNELTSSRPFGLRLPLLAPGIRSPIFDYPVSTERRTEVRIHYQTPGWPDRRNEAHTVPQNPDSETSKMSSFYLWRALPGLWVVVGPCDSELTLSNPCPILSSRT